MPSKLEEVLNQIAELQQMRSTGALSESDYIGLREDILERALPGNRGPGPAALDTRLPYDTQDADDAAGLKRSLLVIALLAVIAAPLVTAGYFQLVSHANFLRAARRVSPSPAPRIVARVNVPARPPAPKVEDIARLPENKILAPQSPPAPVGAANPQATEESLPTAVGQCAQTAVTKVTRRSYNDPGMSSFGSAIQYKNGGRQISAEQIGGIDASMPGDRVRLCLVSRADRCPGGGKAGAVYRALNLRTGENWYAQDSVQGCGGP